MTRLLLLARGGLLTFVALVAVLHALRPGLAPADHFVSEYGVGSTHAVMVVAFLAWAAGLAATAAYARRREGLVVVPVAVAIAALGAVLCACFATVTVGGELPKGVTYTAAGRWHDRGTLLILVGLLVAALASLRGRPKRYRWQVAGCAAALVLIPGVLVAAGLDWPGVGQRGLIAVGVLSSWLYLSAADRGPAPGPPRRGPWARARRGRRTPAPASA